MSLEKTLALVLRTTDYSETSKVVTLWTRDFGKVRVLAKGGRRLRSAFEAALDLLSVCNVVFLRKQSDRLDILTEAELVERFGDLRKNLSALLERIPEDRRAAVVESLGDLLAAVRGATEACCPGAFDHLMEGFAAANACGPGDCNCGPATGDVRTTGA